ncbi:MAG: GNAT family N-acetyltransferase [Lachnospiraceae bacterium]|nr:GNAT family N-acetyltransferase [Lachnospiraceae bacterium]
MKDLCIRNVHNTHEKQLALKICDEAFLESIIKRKDYQNLFSKINKFAEFIVAYYRGELVGFSAMYANDKIDKTAYITLIAVRTEFQGIHIGEALIKKCEEIALKKEMVAIKLEVNKSNTRAISFYRKNGFDKLEDDTQTSFYMLKKL